MRIHELLQTAVEQGASDLIVTVGSPPVIRKSGGLVRLSGQRLTPADTDGFLHQLLVEEQREVFARTGEISFSYSVFGTGRFRVQAFRQRGTASITIRTIPTTVRSAVQLGIPDAVLRLALSNSGLVIVAGTPGSGRTTTLACMVDVINTQREAQLVTLEDPIEYLHRHNRSIVNQREIGSDCPSFAVGLNAAIRQTADVIVLGGMDPASVPLMLSAAGNGILVLTLAMARDVREALELVIATFEAHQRRRGCQLLADTLRGVICQQLVPRSGGEGMVAAFEVFVAGTAARELIRSARFRDLPRFLEEAGDPGCTTMRASLAALAAAGQISEAEYHVRCSGLIVHS